MKKNIIALVMLSTCALCAEAEEILQQALYWQITEDTQEKYNPTWVNLYAKLENGTVEIEGSAAAARDSGDQPFEIVGDNGWDWKGYSSVNATYYAELWNEAGAILAVSEKGMSYSELEQFMDITWSGTGGTKQHEGYYTFTFVIPEPTSGVMFLLGLAGLALKRKRLI